MRKWMIRKGERNSIKGKKLSRERARKWEENKRKERKRVS